MGSASLAMTDRRNYVARMLRWLAERGRFWRSHPSRQLHLRETLALGERRFIAVVEFERRKFLIAGTGNSVAMLAELQLAELPNSGASSQNITGAHPAVQPEKSSQRKAAAVQLHEEVPTWEFTTLGPERQLIRR